MSGRLKKILLLLLAVVLLVGVAQIQQALNRDRDRLGLTRVEALENAPPLLAFTTVALGGFRGLIANALWIRASDLQEEDKFFEMAQLADWITKLEPHFVQVWVMQAWNMTYNISVNFKDFADRWRWVEQGIELLRDEGLRYNPNAPLIYRELGWFFQDKMGGSIDDANLYYKQQWANEMAQVFGKLRKPDLDELINPKTDDEKRRAKLLREKYKMDPKFMKQVDERYGPLEWRLPEAHAIYWGALGLEKAKEHPTKVNEDELIQLRRLIYQSMLLSFQRAGWKQIRMTALSNLDRTSTSFPKSMPLTKSRWPRMRGIATPSAARGGISCNRRSTFSTSTTGCPKPQSGFVFLARNIRTNRCSPTTQIHCRVKSHWTNTSSPVPSKA